jgi:hypothetical protein
LNLLVRDHPAGMSSLARRTGLAGFSLVALIVLAAPTASSSRARPRPSAYRFATFTLASSPPSRPRTRCPSRRRSCANGAAEPAIRADPRGRFYASSENGVLHGTDAWVSVDGGRHFRTLPSPNGGSRSRDSFAPGGGDTDLAIAPVRNRRGFYNAYVASLSLANIDVSTSPDGGRTWRLNPTGGRIPLDDREWVAADGRDKVCTSYHDAATSNIDVDCSSDAGASFSQHAQPGAIDAAHAYLVGNNQIGNLAIDPRSHVFYQAFNGIAAARESVCSAIGTCAFHAVWIAVSTDGGRTFVDHRVFAARDANVSFNHQFVNVTVDRAGTAYVVFSDNRSIYYSYSRTHGLAWSKPVRITHAPARTAIFPWSSAGARGRLDVVWYGSAYARRGVVPDDYPASARWYVFFAQSSSADRGLPHFRQVRATPIVHRGSVCEGGISCTGNRDLYDDFGVADNPRTGRAAIAYSDDQYRRDRANRPVAGCTRRSSNTARCDHTAIAVQLATPHASRR